MLHQFNNLSSGALMHPALAAEQADGVKLCCGTSLTYTMLLGKFSCCPACLAAELDFPCCAFVHPATAAESLHCTQQLMFRCNQGLLSCILVMYKNLTAGFLHGSAALQQKLILLTCHSTRPNDLLHLRYYEAG